MNPILARIPKNIAGLIFDLDGTLANTLPLHYEAWKKAGEEHGVKVTPDDVDRYTGIPTPKVAVILSKDYSWKIDPNLVAQSKQKFYTLLKADFGKIKAFPLTEDLVYHFHGQIPLAIGTGSKKSSALMALEDMELKSYFKSIVTATDVVNPKPDPETFLTCAKEMNVNPENCLVLEDGDMGIQAAQTAGMHYIDVRGIVH